MKIFMLVLFFATFALCQDSTNPQGFPYFSPTAVQELLLNSTVSSLFTNQTLSEFYYVWVPQNVGSVRYNLSVTGDELCASYFGAVINLVEAHGSTSPDFSLGYPCFEPGSDLFCSYTNDILVGNSSRVFSYGNGLFPGQYHYITVLTAFYTMECSYNLTTEILLECPAHQVPVTYFMTCVDVTNVTNGQVVSNTTNSVDVYRFVVPQNVSRIWVGLTSNTSDTVLMDGIGWAVIDSDQNWSSSYPYLGYNDTTGLYYWATEFRLPYGDYPTYFSVGPQGNNPISYEMAFYWSYCGANSTGLGEAQYSPSTELIDFLIPDCSHPYTYNQLPLKNGTYSLSVPAQNNVTYEAGADFIAFSVAPQTVGTVSVTCESTTGSTFVSLAHNQLTSCTFGVSNCDGSPVYFLSEELWIGGQWSVAICNPDDTGSDSVTITVTAIGVATPVPSPGASASPSSPAEHSSGASKMLPVLLFVFLIAAALVQV